MMGRYRATATLSGGEQIQIVGNLRECANWADNIIRANDGEISIRIVRIKQTEGRP